MFKQFLAWWRREQPIERKGMVSGKAQAPKRPPPPAPSVRNTSALQDTSEYFAPHCDDLVLHRPKSCYACDMFPARQHEREVTGVNYTGEHDPKKLLCPSEARRPIESINRWYGNVAQTREQADAHYARRERELREALADLGVAYPGD